MHFGLPYKLGDRTIDPGAYINDAIMKLPKLSSSEAQAVMKDLYDREYKIFDHFSAKNRPLSSVATQYAESRDALSTISDYIDIYIERELHSHGITFEAFMNMPSYVVKRILIKVSAKEAKKTATIDGILDGTKTKK